MGLLDWTWLRKLSQHEDMTMDISKAEKAKKKKTGKKKWNIISPNCGTVVKDVTFT